MEWYFAIKTLHIISATILFGAGIGIAFFMIRSWFTADIQNKLYAAKNTVLADTLLTLPAVIIQPVSGIALMEMAGFNWGDLWVKLTLVIYVLVGLCWLPVVWIQIQLRTLCQHATTTKTPLPKRYYTLFKLWFILGWPAFIGLIVVFYLMVAKPV